MSHRFPTDDLMALARATPDNRNATLLRAATALFCQEPSHDRDAVHRYEQLSVYFLPKVGVSDRAYVSALLATRDDAPVATVRMLARDSIEVAGPVLRQSPVLSPIDLLGVIAVTGPAHHQIIAGRTALTDQVRTALVRAAGLDTRPGLPAAPAPATAASAPVAAIAASEPADDVVPVVDFLEMPARERLRMLGAIASRAPGKGSEPPLRRVERALRQAYASADIVVRARTGDRDGLVRAFAEILDIDAALIRRLVADPSGEPLVLLIKASRLSESDGRTVLLLANPAIGGSVDTFFRLADLLAAIEPAVAERVVAGWRESPAPAPATHVPAFADNPARRATPSAIPATPEPAVLPEKRWA